MTPDPERARAQAPSPTRAAQAIAPGLEALPRRFGRYQLFDRIGHGGMASIYLARMESELGAERLVVVKLIHEALSKDPAFSTQFVDEAKLCAGLRHANIAQVVDLGRADPADRSSQLFMAMEYVEGFDLQQLLRKLAQTKIPLPPEFALHVVRETLAGLDFAHRATGAEGKVLGIVHRDVSPSNVLLSFEGEVKLCDFGIAKAFGRAGEMGLDGGSADAQGAGPVVGKSAYMSPEQARGEPLDGRADVFAAGILLWEMCAGRRLYKGTEAQMLDLARGAEIPRLPARGLPGHDELQALLDRALAPDRDARFPSAKAMLEALEAYIAKHRLFTSQLRFAAFLTDHFSHDVVAERRAKELAAREASATPEVVAATPPAATVATSTTTAGTATPSVPAPTTPAGPKAGEPGKGSGPKPGAATARSKQRKAHPGIDHAVAEEKTVLRTPAALPRVEAPPVAPRAEPAPVSTAHLGVAATILVLLAAAIGAGLFWLVTR
jgi:serine/threonine-protein kinase